MEEIYKPIGIKNIMKKIKRKTNYEVKNIMKKIKRKSNYGIKII
jgi:hypothetical protein